MSASPSGLFLLGDLWALRLAWLFGLSASPKSRILGGTFLSLLCAQWIYSGWCYYGAAISPLHTGKGFSFLREHFCFILFGVRVVNIIVVNGFAVMGWRSGREESDWNYTSSVHRILIKTDFCPVSHSYSLSGLTIENRFILVKTLSPGSHTCWFKQ